MSDHIFDDYDKFIGKHIAVIFEYGSKCKKLSCNLLEYYRKDSRKRFIKLKADNNTIYHVNCDKIICWIAEHEDMFNENGDSYKLEVKPIKANTRIQSEELSLKKSQDVELLQNKENTNIYSINFTKEDTSPTSNENVVYDEFQENDAISSEDGNKFEQSQGFIENYKLDANPIEVNTIIQSEELSSKGAQDIETTPSEIITSNIILHDVELLQSKESINICSIISSKEYTSPTSNENAIYDELQENDVIPSEDRNKAEPSLASIDNTAITSDQHTINSIMIDMELNNDKIITDYKEVYGGDQVLEQYKKKDTYKKNDLSSPLATFINSNFQGAYLTIYTSSTQAISGEVIFNYDYLIVLKADSKNYYINPEQITYFK